MDQINSELEEIENSKRDNTPKKVRKLSQYLLQIDNIGICF